MSKDIALGKTTNYNDQYTTRDLYPINREERRKNYTKMYGFDIWTVYEFSFLLPSGLPQFHVLRITNLVDSKNIFESKGLKLYLNSFNNSIFDNLNHALSVVEKDLNELTKSGVKIEVVTEFPHDIYRDSSIDLDDEFFDQIDVYDYDSNLLKVINQSGVEEKLISSLLRSNCEVTGQPDWGRVFIQYKGDKKIDHSSLLKYIVSYRRHKEFHEPTCERIYQDLYNILDPEFLLVICQYTRRGGIDINPVRCNIPITGIQLPKIIHQ